MTNTYYEVIDTEISIEEVTKKVIRRECGAVTTFIGTVREFTKGRRTLYLEYVAYKTMAEKMLENRIRSEREMARYTRCDYTSHRYVANF